MATKAIPVVAAKVPSTQTNFPVYIKPSAMTGWTTLTTAEANSIRFYSDSGLTTELAREVVSSDEIHVKVPSLTTTTTIYADYDGVRADYAATDTYGRNAVWSGFRTVRHLEASGVDSTGNLNNTDDTLSFVSGQVGGAADFNGTTSRITTTTGSTSAGTYTTSFWMRTSINDDPIITFTNVAGTATSGYQINIVINTTGKISVVAGPATPASYNTGDWVYITVTGDGPGNSGAIYANGVSVATGGCFDFAATTIYYRIGNYSDSVSNRYNGDLDEIRWVTGSILSADWITTEYNNQSDVATFWGTVTDAGGAAATGFMAFM